ncbi:hypothetical protein [Microbulbifer marinus]|uniref:Uncharacterized protein n=1 Tax=Microbulbifer marinus TaxID=658218 RepID=A0A1H4A8Q5_9GAMM|nr:hypothetical protein [Microbulbifer marinus]SEA32081.1 hypothetical protein SAMN05216562_2605 [Microbulbifer marinus]
MAGRKNKHKQRGHQRGQSGDLLNELNSLRDLLGSEELGDIPLLDQVASPGQPPASATPPASPRPPEPLDEIDLPILFSPVDEEPSEDYRTELNESDLKLLRPLQDLPPADLGSELPTAKEQPQPTPGARKRAVLQEQQQELFAPPAASPVGENPFLPEHIRARLTGGRVPKSEDLAPEPAPADVTLIPEELLDTAPAAASTEALAPNSVPVELPAAEARDPEPPAAEPGQSEPVTESADAAALSARQRERQQLVDRLVAKQLPVLERQLRARIELMLDELEARD